MRPEAIIFDIGDTLSEDKSLRLCAIQHAAAELSRRRQIPDSGQFIREYQQVEATISGPAENHLFSSKVLVATVLSNLRIDASPEAVFGYIALHRAYVWAKLERRSDLVDFFAYLVQIGMRLAALTDGSTLEQFQILERLGVLQFMETVVTSEEVGVVKPSVKMFECILRRLGVDSTRVLMVGNDEEKDIEPAKKLGMMTALVCKEAAPDFDHEPRHTVLSDVMQLRRLFPPPSAQR